MSGFFANGKGAANPLNQLGNREGVDRSLFKDRQVGQGSSSYKPAPQQVSHQSQSDQQFQHPPQPFNLSHLSAALSHPAQGTARVDFSEDWARAGRQGSSASPSFSSDFQQWSGPRENWAEGYDVKGKGRMSSPPPSAAEGRGYQAPYPSMPMVMGMGMGMGTAMNMGHSSFQPMYQGQFPHQSQSGPRQMDRAEQERMEAAFEQALEDARAQTRGEEEADTKTTSEAETPAEETREAKGDFDAVWESLRPEAERLNKLAEWERDFSQFTNDEDDLFETLNDSLNRDDVGQHSLDDQLDLSHFSPSQEYRNSLHGETPQEEALNEQIAREFNEWKSREALPENGIPNSRPYQWADQHPFNDLAPADSWQQANELLATGGSLSDVTYHLENYLRRGRATLESQAQMPVSEVEAWSLLGRVHAMNEKEDRALAAFEAGRKALEAGQGGQNIAGEMLTNLAISYVNESEDLAALTTLHQFLTTSHPTHAGPAPTRTQMTESQSPWALHQALTNSFLDLAREQYGSQGVVDPDVQVGLGTAYYMMGEYEEARKCWVAALGERPDDYLLWNRLGATLANGGNPEEAVDAYRKALELKPTFTRAIFNLGVACLNIGVHKEAAEHFLAALSMHTRLREADAQISESMSIWSTLRRALVAMDMDDLATKANPGANLEDFRQAGFNF